MYIWENLDLRWKGIKIKHPMASRIKQWCRNKSHLHLQSFSFFTIVRILFFLVLPYLQMTFFSQWIHASRTPYYASSHMPPGSTTKTKPFQSTTPCSTNYRVPKQTNFLQHSKWAASVCELTVPSHGWSTVLVLTTPVPVTWEENLLWNLVQVPMIT